MSSYYTVKLKRHGADFRPKSSTKGEKIDLIKSEFVSALTENPTVNSHE